MRGSVIPFAAAPKTRYREYMRRIPQYSVNYRELHFFRISAASRTAPGGLTDGVGRRKLAPTQSGA